MTTQIPHQIFKHSQRLNAREAAAYLGVAYQSLCNMRHQRRGPAYIKVGRKVVYNIADLDSYLDNNRVVLD